MKNRFLNFLRKYWLSILLSVIMLIGIFLSTRYADLYHNGSDILPMNLRDLYIIYAMPLCSLIYGCLSYIKAKKIWFPQLILFVITTTYWLVFDINTTDWEGAYIIWSAVLVLFSLIGSSMTAFVYFMKKTIKENNEAYLE